MRISLLEIRRSDERLIDDVPSGDTVYDAVVLEVGGTQMAFQVSVLARPLPGFDASVVNGEFRLEELLRYQPEALSQLCSLVGKARRGHAVQLPTVLVARDGAPDEVALGS